MQYPRTKILRRFAVLNAKQINPSVHHYWVWTKYSYSSYPLPVHSWLSIIGTVDQHGRHPTATNTLLFVSFRCAAKLAVGLYRRISLKYRLAKHVCRV